MPDSPRLAPSSCALAACAALALWSAAGCVAPAMDVDPPPGSCRGNFDCDGDSICRAGRCEQAPRGGCAGGCADGAICASGRCVGVAELCVVPGACRCAVVAPGGGLTVDGAPPRWTLAAGELLRPTVALATAGGRPLPAPPTAAGAVTLAAPAGDAWIVAADGALVAGRTAGDATATVTPVPGVSCALALRSLGAAPPGTVTVVALVAGRAEPLPGAAVWAATAGEAPTVVAVADGTGVAHFAAASSRLDVTVVAAGHAPVTVAGIDVARAPVLRLALVPSAADVGVLTGTVDMAPYVSSVLGGTAWPVSVALGGIAQGLAGIITPPAPAVALAACMGRGADTAPVADGPTCAMLPTQGFQVPVPESLMVRGEGNFALRPQIIAAGRPGPALAWVVGGQMRDEVAGQLERAGQAWVGACEGEPSQCAAAQRAAPAALAAHFLGILPQMAVGIRPLALPPTAAADYRALHTKDASPVASVRMLSDPAVAVSPEVAFNRLALIRPPAFTPDSGLDVAVAFHGARLPGLGVVPLGGGLALDCDGGACVGEQDHPPEGAAPVADGRLDAMPLCPDGACPQGVPAGTDAGDLPLFVADGVLGLEAQPRVTVLLAAGLRAALENNDAPPRLHGIVRPGPLAGGEAATVDRPDWGAPPPPARLSAAGTIDYAADPAGRLRLMVLPLADGGAWRIYHGADAGALRLPTAAALTPTVGATVPYAACGLTAGADLVSLAAANGGLDLVEVDAAVADFALTWLPIGD